jgi:hypothetical protein
VSGDAYASLSAEKAARKSAKNAVAKDGLSAREKMKLAQIEMQEEADKKKKKKGWFK